MNHCSRFIVWLLLILPSAVLAYNDCRPDGRLLESTPNGTIDWTEHTITALAEPGCPPDPGAAGETAMQNAGANLLAMVLSMPLDSSLNVADRVSRDPLMRAQLEEILATAEPFYVDSGRQGAVRLRLGGAFFQLILPEGIKQLTAIQTIPTTGKNHSAAKTRQDTDQFTGLVLDARATKANPVLVAEIIDENGRQIYGPEFISREFAVQYGVAIYARCVDQTVKKRVGENPLTIRALKALGANRSVLVVSNGDALRLRSVSSHLFFLKQGKVAILLNQPNRDEP